MQIFFEGSLMNAILLLGISQHLSFMHKAEISHIYHVTWPYTAAHTSQLIQYRSLRFTISAEYAPLTLWNTEELDGNKAEFDAS